MVVLLCLLVTAEVWRFLVQWNVHAFIDSVLVAYIAVWTWHDRSVIHSPRDDERKMS